MIQQFLWVSQIDQLITYFCFGGTYLVFQRRLEESNQPLLRAHGASLQGTVAQLEDSHDAM